MRCYGIDVRFMKSFAVFVDSRGTQGAALAVQHRRQQTLEQEPGSTRHGVIISCEGDVCSDTVGQSSRWHVFGRGLCQRPRV